MGLFDKAKQAAALAKEKAVENSDQIRSGLDKAAEAADSKTGGKYSEKIAGARAKADGAIDKLDDKPADEPGQP